VYLLDTNALSAIIHDPAGRVAQRLALVGAEQVCTSVIVAAELRYGAERRGAPRLTQRVQDLLGLINVRALEAPANQI
jgi:tRNA(fMet)-specific endonuclease VapC